MATNIHLSPTTISCPFPDNLTPLSPNGFMFNVAKLPDMNFFCQQVDLPQLDLGDIEMATPLVMNPIPGEMLTFSELHVQFLVDSEMKNYQAIFNWLNGLGFPQDNTQYTVIQTLHYIFSSLYCLDCHCQIVQLLRSI